MFYFNKLSPNSFALLAAFLGILLTYSLNTDEQNAMGNFFNSLGQTLATSATQAENIQSRCEMMKQMEDLREQLETLKKKLK